MIQKIAKKIRLMPLVLGLLLSSIVFADESVKIALSPLTSIRAEKVITDVFEICSNLSGQFERCSNLSGQKIFDQINAYWKQDFKDSKDYLNKKGRYQKALVDLHAQISEGELQERLSSGDLKAITTYTDEKKDKKTGQPLSEEKQAYSIVNSSLWAQAKSGQALPASVKKFVAQFDSALSKLPTFGGILFRGTSFSLGEANLILSGQKKEKIAAAYTSTSLDIGDAFDFVRRQNNKDKIKTLMVIEGEGKLISLRGDFVREEEILIQRNAKFNFVRAFKVQVGNEDEGYVDWMILFCKLNQ